MSRLIFLLVPAALFAGQTRYARLGEFDGKVEVQLHAANPWSLAERNLLLTESAWLRTAPAARLEIELDEGSAFRLGPDSQIELSDYSRASTGQRITVLRSITASPGLPASLPATIPLPRRSRRPGHPHPRRAHPPPGRSHRQPYSVIEGVVRSPAPPPSFDIHEGQTVRVEPHTLPASRSTAKSPRLPSSTAGAKIATSCSSPPHPPITSPSTTAPAISMLPATG